jgi:hypothetical protein
MVLTVPARARLSMVIHSCASKSTAASHFSNTRTRNPRLTAAVSKKCSSFVSVRIHHGAAIFSPDINDEDIFLFVVFGQQFHNLSVAAVTGGKGAPRYSRPGAWHWSWPF